MTRNYLRAHKNYSVRINSRNSEKKYRSEKLSEEMKRPLNYHVLQAESDYCGL